MAVREDRFVVEVSVLREEDVAPALIGTLRALTFAAFGGRFDEHDWQHTYGGTRVVAVEDGEPVAAGAVVPRLLVVGDRPFDTGYVEGVATAPGRHGAGLGTAVMSACAAVVRDHFELGALSTGAQPFYERLGWERWRGPTYVRLDAGRVERTPGEDDSLMVLRTGPSADLDLTASISCPARAGDDW
jgi:aminoglycoside 2'-N-acetyltransferase I